MFQRSNAIYSLGFVTSWKALFFSLSHRCELHSGSKVQDAQLHTWQSEIQNQLSNLARQHIHLRLQGQHISRSYRGTYTTPESKMGMYSSEMDSLPKPCSFSPVQTQSSLFLYVHKTSVEAELTTIPHSWTLLTSLTLLQGLWLERSPPPAKQV